MPSSNRRSTENADTPLRVFKLNRNYLSLLSRAHAQTRLVRDGVVVALMKLIHVESVPAHRLVSGCLVNLTTTRDVTWELIQAKGHQVNFFNACATTCGMFHSVVGVQQGVQHLLCCCTHGISSAASALSS